MEAASQGIVALNRAIMRRQPLPPLYRSNVRYQKESLGSENWRTADEVYRLGYGDCEDLANYRTAELQLEGELATTKIRRTGFRKFHAVVRRENGRIEDPSRRLGMR